MGAFGKLLIKTLGGNLEVYDGNSSTTRNYRIARCCHCLEITRQRDNIGISKYGGEWLCLHCGTFADILQCNCGNCKTHPYGKTGLTKKDITK